MKQLIMSTLRDTPPLQDILDRRIYGAGVLGTNGIPPNPAKPYIQYNELQSFSFREVRETSNAKNRFFQIFVYDDRGSYTRINNALNIVDEALKGLVGQRSPTGILCLDSFISGRSRELEDAQYHAFVKFTTVEFTTSG